MQAAPGKNHREQACNLTKSDLLTGSEGENSKDQWNSLDKIWWAANSEVGFSLKDSEGHSKGLEVGIN